MWNGNSRAEGGCGPRPLLIDQQRVSVVGVSEGNCRQHALQLTPVHNTSASGQQQHQHFGQQHYMRGQQFVNMQNVPSFHHPPPPYHPMSVRSPGILPPPLMVVQPQFGTCHDSSLYSPMIGPPTVNPPTWGLPNRHSSAFSGVPEEGAAFCQACGSSLRSVPHAAAISTSHNHNTQPNSMQNGRAQRNSRENNEHETANRGIVPISAPVSSSAEVSETANPAFLRSFKEGLRYFIKEILNEEKEKKKKEKKQKQAAAKAAAELSVAGAQEPVEKWLELMTFSEDEAVEDPETVTVEVNEAIHLAVLDGDVKDAIVSTGKLDIVGTTEAWMLQSMEDIPSTSTTNGVSTGTSDPSAQNDEEKEGRMVFKIKKAEAFGEQ